MSTKQQIEEEKVKKQAIKIMKELIRRIERGDLLVESNGFWQGVPGSYTFRVIVKDSES